MSLDNTAKLSDIITSLQEVQGINQKAELKSALVSKGISVADTDNMADMINKINSSLYGSNIKSIQRGTTTLTGSNASKTIQITPVDTTKCLCYISIPTNTNGTAKYDVCTIQLTDSQTITISRAAGSYDVVLNWEVVEFNNVKSLQLGSFNNTLSSPRNVNVTTVNPLKSKLVWSCTTTSSLSDVPSYLMSMNIVDATTIAAHFYGTSYSYSFTVHWQLIEFN